MLQRRVMCVCVCVALVLALQGSAAVAKSKGTTQPRFKSAPRVVVEDGKVAVTFAVTKATDVAVTIRKGDRIVRHLAAGVLGRNPPAPLKPGLRQRLTWDGRNDAGNAVRPAGCTVHVGLGMKPRFDRVLGWKGEAIGGGIAGLTVDAKGNLYVLNSGFKRPMRLCVLNREGKYVRSVVPYPADLPREKVESLGTIELSEGERVPVIRHPVYFGNYPEGFGSTYGGGLPQQTMVLVGDKLVMTNAWSAKYTVNVGKRRLLILNTDGSAPANYLGPLLADGRRPGYVHLAAAPDGKSVFCTGLVDRDDWKTAKPFHAVYKVGLDEKGPPKVYLGQPRKAGDDAKHFNDPRGLAVDRQGNLYVSDWGNNRIVVFKPDGGYLGKVAVVGPGQLAVHPKTDAVYVMRVSKRRFPIGGGKSHPIKFEKLSAFVTAEGEWAGGAKVTAKTTLPYGLEVFALDGTAEPASIWLGSRFDSPALFRIEEKGDAFSQPQPVLPRDDPAFHVGGVLAVDRRRDIVYARRLNVPGWHPKGADRLVRINGRTGRAKLLDIEVEDLAVGPKGNLYVVQDRGVSYETRYVSAVCRLDPSGKAVPFAGTGTNVLVRGDFLKGTFFPYQHRPRGLSVAPNGDILMVYPSHHLDKPQKYVHCTVDVYGPDGKLKGDRVVWASNAAHSVRADAAGNIYVADNVKPTGQVLPAELQGKVPAKTRWKHGFNWYPWLYGSVVKFPPAGGAIKIRSTWGASHWGWKPLPLPKWETAGVSESPEPVECVSGYGAKAHLQNALRTFGGISPAPAVGGWGCVCFSSRFDLDAFGRLFLPDLAACSVRVMDANGNAIVRFGRYGNMDSRGPRSPVPTPRIAFAWPQYVAVSDEAVYVSDVVNRRIVRVKLDYTTEAQSPLN